MFLFNFYLLSHFLLVWYYKNRDHGKTIVLSGISRQPNSLLKRSSSHVISPQSYWDSMDIKLKHKLGSATLIPLKLPVTNSAGLCVFPDKSWCNWIALWILRIRERRLSMNSLSAFCTLEGSYIKNIGEEKWNKDTILSKPCKGQICEKK